MHRRHLSQARRRPVDEIVREVHEERLVADDRLRTPHRVTETERRRLPDVDAARPRRHDVLQRLQQVDLALRFERLLQLVVGVEVIFDRALRAAGDEDQLAGARSERLLRGVLDQRLVDDGQHFLRAGLGRRQEARAAPCHRKHRRSDLLRLGHRAPPSYSQERDDTRKTGRSALRCPVEAAEALSTTSVERRGFCRTTRSSCVARPRSWHPL